MDLLTLFLFQVKITTTDLLNQFDQINKLIYERATYLKCFKDENIVPVHFRTKEVNPLIKMPSSENIEMGTGHASVVSIAGNKQQTESLSSIGKKSGGIQNQRYTSSFYSKSNKFGSDDTALTIMKNILQNNVQNEVNKQGNLKRIYFKAIHIK